MIHKLNGRLAIEETFIFMMESIGNLECVCHLVETEIATVGIVGVAIQEIVPGKHDKSSGVNLAAMITVCNSREVVIGINQYAIKMTEINRRQSKRDLHS